MEWIQEHWQDIAIVAGALILIARVVARITPTEADNRIVRQVQRIAKVIGIDVPDNAGKNWRDK